VNRGIRLPIAGLGVALLAAIAFSAYTMRRAERVPADIAVITHGKEVDLAAHVAPGKYTVFDFYAPWCPPCRVLGPALERLAGRAHARLALRKVDIVDWTEPVARQYGVESLPYLVLYDDRGQQVAAGDEVFSVLKREFGEAANEVTELMGQETARPDTRTGS
jgi:thioredoxin-like negative regulator of GroEL